MSNFDRNKCLLLGVLLVLIGVQLRLVESFTLTPEATDLMAKYVASEEDSRSESPLAFQRPLTAEPAARTGKVVRPPRWLGLASFAVGAVLILHSFVMPAPGGKSGGSDKGH